MEIEIQKIANEIFNNCDEIFDSSDNNQGYRNNDKHNNENIESKNGNKPFDEKTNELCQICDIITSIPGAGELITPLTIISEIGDVNRFETKRHFVSYIRFDPTVLQSGKYHRNKRISKIRK